MKQIALIVFSLFFIMSMPFVGATANVDISINVPPPPLPPPPLGPPPPLEFSGPPDVVVVPSGPSDVYLVPNMVGLYFYGGFWYRFHRGYWFRASLYSGPWITIRETLVPRDVVIIPPDYILVMPPGYHRIHYGDFHRHWRDWGHNRSWKNQSWYRDHSHRHWGGRDFHKPPAVHRGNVHGPGGRRPEFKHGDRRPRGAGPGGPRPGSGPKVGTGSGPGGPGGANHGRPGPEGKKQRVAGPKTDHPAKPR